MHWLCTELPVIMLPLLTPIRLSIQRTTLWSLRTLDGVPNSSTAPIKRRKTVAAQLLFAHPMQVINLEYPSIPVYRKNYKNHIHTLLLLLILRAQVQGCMSVSWTQCPAGEVTKVMQVFAGWMYNNLGTISGPYCLLHSVYHSKYNWLTLCECLCQTWVTKELLHTCTKVSSTV